MPLLFFSLDKIVFSLHKTVFLKAKDLSHLHFWIRDKKNTWVYIIVVRRFALSFFFFLLVHVTIKMT